jgi:hypothetical protein
VTLILKRASASRPSGEWSDDDYDVLADGIVVGRIMNAAAAPVGSSWLWTYGFDPRERRPAHGYGRTREAAVAAFAKGWRRGERKKGGDSAQSHPRPARAGRKEKNGASPPRLVPAKTAAKLLQRGANPSTRRGR